jgi:hypothetical protein
LSSSVIPFPSRLGVHSNASVVSADARDRWARRRIGLVWGLLFLNVLTFADGTWNQEPLIVHIPTFVGKIITQGALPVALLLALTVNRRLVIRTNVFLCLLSLLALVAVVSGVHPAGHFTGTLFRTVRLGTFVATLWLLSPWWGRRDLLLLRSQLTVLSVVLGSVLLGLLVAPGRALAQGRLSGEFWPTPPTQVADFAAVTVGLVVVLWTCGVLRGRIALFVALVGGAMLVLTHSRTSLIGMVAGVFVAGLSVFLAKARVRKMFAGVAVMVSLAVIASGGLVTTWLARGQNVQELEGLTGRTSVWSGVVNAPRDPFQILFGFGLSNKSFDGFPIDSNWLAAYMDLGLIGVILSATMLLFVLLSAYFRPAGAQRALALFLVTYLLITSLTATGLSDASVALLELALAASLLAPAMPEIQPT